MNIGPILNGYRDMVKIDTDYPASTNSNYVINNITTNITCIVIRRVNHHVRKCKYGTTEPDYQHTSDCLRSPCSTKPLQRVHKYIEVGGGIFENLL